MTAQGSVSLCKICYIGVFSVFLLVSNKRAACFDADVKPFFDHCLVSRSVL